MLLPLLLFAASCPANAAAAEEQGRAALSHRDYAAAIGHLKEAQTACPNENTIALELANAYFMSQHFGAAKGIVARVLAIEPANPAALELRGNVQFLEGETQAAIATFIDLLEKHPDNKEAPYMLGRIYYQQGSLDQAIGQFERALKVDPRSYKAYDGLGLCYEAKSENDRAIRHFLTAIKLAAADRPDYDTAFADLAELLLKAGDAEKAFGAASNAADRNPYSARNFYLGGRALERLDKMELSVNWLERSAALDPSYPEPQYALARIYRRLGETSKAEQAQQKFLAAKAKTKRMGPM
jgi:predicted Zn-dependent protease